MRARRYLPSGHFSRCLSASFEVSTLHSPGFARGEQRYSDSAMMLAQGEGNAVRHPVEPHLCEVGTSDPLS